MGRKEKFTPEQVIGALHETKGMTTLAARRLGCDFVTLQRYVRVYPAVARALKEEHENAGDVVELALWDEAVNKRNTAALIFLAKTKYKERGYVERQEVTGANGGALRLEWIDPLAGEDEIGIGANELTDAGAGETA